MKEYLTRKESIIISAVEIIDEKGLNELSIRELANRQGVSEAALYRHFKSKEDIILAIFEYYSRFDTNIMNTIKNSEMNPQEGIIFFIKSLVECYESHPALSALSFAYEMIINEDIIVQKLKEIFYDRWNFIKKLIDDGQKDGCISSKINCENLCDIIFGTKSMILLRWRMEKYSFPLKERVIQSLESVLNC